MQCFSIDVLTLENEGRSLKERASMLLFIVAAFLMLCYPYYGFVLDNAIELSGVTASVELEDVSIQSVMDGSFQSGLNTWIENHFPGRNLLIKLRSQMLYSLFNESPNSNVYIGKDKYLFEIGYITDELGLTVVDESRMDAEIQQLEELQALLQEKGKELYLFITPSKAHFCKDKIPSFYLELEKEGNNNYQRFVEKLSKSNLLYFDAHQYIEQYDGPELKAPVFYPTGTHWSSSYGYSAAKAFSEFISAKGKWNLSTLELTEIESDEPYWPDADLYQSLNLIAKPDEIQYYHAELTVLERKDRPDVFLRGCSFMGQSLNGLIQAGVFSKDAHFENSYCFTDNYSQLHTFSSYTAYDELEELKDYLSASDIIILEVNEVNTGRVGFGIVDYLLDYPEYLDDRAR